jgi:hypothetical protein
MFSRQAFTQKKRLDRLELGPRLQKLAAIGEFSAQELQDLPDLAHAAWYICHRQDEQAALSSEARLSAALAETGARLRARMLRVLDFHFEDDPDVGPTLAYIRRGSGYHDLADDLTGLATLYGRHKGSLHGTPAHYHPGDEKEALAAAARILTELGAGAPPASGPTIRPAPPTSSKPPTKRSPPPPATSAARTRRQRRSFQAFMPLPAAIPPRAKKPTSRRLPPRPSKAAPPGKGRPLENAAKRPPGKGRPLPQGPWPPPPHL